MSTTIPKVMAVGCPNSPEFSTHRGEAPLDQVCRLFGYEAATFRAQNLNALRRMIEYVGRLVRRSQFESDPLFVHIGVQGNPSSLEIGPDSAPWEQLAVMLSDLFRSLAPYPAPVVLVLSARGACEDDLTGLLLKHGRSRKPDHMFVLVDGLARTDAILAWAHLYGMATDIDFASGSVAGAHSIRRLCARMRQLGLGTARYLPGSHRDISVNADQSGTVGRPREPVRRAANER